MFSAPFQKVLNELKVSATHLNDSERKGLDEKGFVVIPDHLPHSLREQLIETVESIFLEEGPAAGIQQQNDSVNLNQFGQEPGARRLSDLVNKGEIFKNIYLDSKLLSAVAHVLQRDFKLSSLNARDVSKGNGYQRLHADWKQDYDQRFHVFNSIWLLDDFTEDNGCIRVVPSTHQLNPPELTDPNDIHPEEQSVVAPKGSVILMNAHLWHGGQKNLNGQSRRVIHAYYTAFEHPQQTSQFDHLKYKTWLNLDESAKVILGLETSKN